MNIDFDALFPDGISDETAAAVGDLLNELSLAWEATYFTLLQRYQARQRKLYDPEAPWRPPPTAPKKPKSR